MHGKGVPEVADAALHTNPLSGVSDTGRSTVARDRRGGGGLPARRRPGFSRSRCGFFSCAAGCGRWSAGFPHDLRRMQMHPVDWSGSRDRTLRPFSRHAGTPSGRRGCEPRGRASRFNGFFVRLHFPLDRFRRPVRPMHLGGGRNGRVGPSVGPRAAQSARRFQRAIVGRSVAHARSQEVEEPLPMTSPSSRRTCASPPHAPHGSTPCSSRCCARGAFT